MKPLPYRTYSLLLAGLLSMLALWAAGIPRLKMAFAPDPTWQRVRMTGIWRVGLDPSFPPLTMLDEKGKPDGVEVRLLRRVAAKMRVRLQITALSSDALYPALWSGQVDSIIGGLPFDPLLTRDVCYSHSYLDGGLLLLWPEKQPQPTLSLAGLRVAVIWGGEGDRYLRDTLRRGSHLVPKRYLTSREALTAVQSGQADAAILDAITAYTQAGKYGLRWREPPLQSLPYHIAMPVGAHHLQAAVNGVLKQLPPQWYLPLFAEFGQRQSCKGE